ncbi:MAG: hypothetical protein SPL16_03115 [Eubacteriales bacterium]|nr:hypothetical protein [Eubacteriales bacterium]
MALSALFLCAGCAGQEDSAIDVTVTAPSGTAAPEEKVQPETAEEAPEAVESHQSPAQADDVRGLWEKIYGYWNGGDQRYAAFTVNKKGLLQFEYGKWDTVGRGAGYVEKALTPIVYGTDDEIRLQVYWPAYESEVTGRLEEMTADVTLRVKDIDNEEIDVKVGDEDWLLGVYGGRTSEEAYIANQN